MKYKVNDSCIGCGLCETTCPEVFSIQGDVAVAIEGEVPEAALAAAAEASSGEHSNLSTIGFAIGFVLMMVLDVVMG